MSKRSSFLHLRAGKAEEPKLSATTVVIDGNEGIVSFCDGITMRARIDIDAWILEGVVLSKKGQEIFKMTMQRSMFCIVFADIPQQVAAQYWMAAAEYLRSHNLQATNILYGAMYNSLCFDPIGALKALHNGSAPVQASTW